MPSFRSARAEGNSKELSQVQKKKKPLKLSSQWRLPEAGEILEVREDGGNAARRSWRLAGSSVGPFDAHIQVARQQWKQWKLKPMSAGGGTYLQSPQTILCCDGHATGLFALQPHHASSWLFLALMSIHSKTFWRTYPRYRIIDWSCLHRMQGQRPSVTLTGLFRNACT